MSSKKGTKKKRLPESVRPTRTSTSSHRPRANAATGKRWRHKPVPPRPPESAPPTAIGLPGRPVLEPVSFTEEDPAAWTWLNVWPFRDDGDPVAEPFAGAATLEAEPGADPSTTVEAERPARVPSLAVIRTWPEEPESFSPPRTRGGAQIAALVAAAVVLAGALAWLAMGRGTEERVYLAHNAYAAPVHLPRATSFVRSRVLASGNLEVTHWIHTSRAVDSLTVRTPRTPGLAPGSVSMSHVVLATDATLFPAVPIGGGHPGTQTFRFPLTNQVYLRYRLSGAIRASGPHGRALARITSLDVTFDSRMVRTTQRVTGARVLALACSAPSGTALPQPCGVESNGSWHVSLGRTERHERVMAQLDLP